MTLASLSVLLVMFVALVVFVLLARGHGRRARTSDTVRAARAAIAVTVGAALVLAGVSALSLSGPSTVAAAPTPPASVADAQKTATAKSKPAPPHTKVMTADGRLVPSGSVTSVAATDNANKRAETVAADAARHRFVKSGITRTSPASNPHTNRWHRIPGVDAPATTTVAALAAPSGTGTYKGTVRDQLTNAPIPGVDVILGTDCETDTCPDPLTQKTAIDGTFSFTGLVAGEYYVTFDDHVSSHISAFDDFVLGNGATKTVTQLLVPGGSVSGTVTASAGGAPIAGVCVSLESVDDEGDFEGAGGCTGADGTFHTTGAPAGNYRVYFSDDADDSYLGQYYDNADFDGATSVAVNQGAVTTGINAALARGGTISGTVTSATTHAPLADVCVDVYKVGSEDDEVADGCTDATGHYRTSGMAGGTYKVQFEGTDTHLGQWFSDAGTFATATPVTVTFGSDTSGIDAALARGATISGTITKSGGAPVDDACVTATVGEDDGAADCTDAAGHFMIQGLLGGSYTLSVEADGFVDYTYPTKYTVVVGQDVVGADAQLVTGGTITGTVTDAVTHAPIEDACVDATLKGEDDGPDRFTCTDEAGAYAIGGLSTGTYVVTFDADGHVDQSRDVDVVVGQTTANVNAALAQAGSIAGTLTAEGTGSPVGGTVTVYTSGADPEEVASTDADEDSGTYEVDGLPAGSYKVQFEPSDDNLVAEWWNAKSDISLADDVTVTDGSTTGGIDASFGAGISISGTITDAASGDPIAACVSLTSDDEYLDKSMCTSDNGKYTLGGLVAGTYRVSADADGHLSGQSDPVTITTASVTGVDLALTAAGTVSGTITAADTSAPIAVDEPTCAYLYKPSDVRDAVASSCADESGKYQVPGLAAGTYYVQFRSAAAYAPQWYNDEASSATSDPITVTSGSDTPGVDATLAVGGRISGTVTGAAPGDQGCVSIFTADDTSYPVASACTDDSNDYVSEGLPAGADYIATADYDSWYDHKDNSTDATHIAVTAGHDTTGIDLTVGPAQVEVTGTVTNGVSGPPVYDAYVAAYDAVTGDFVRETYAAQGKYDLFVPPGSYRLQASSAGDRWPARWYVNAATFATATTVPLTDSSVPHTYDLTVADTPERITGTVTTDDGKPISNAYVTADSGSSYYFTYSDELGHYVLPVTPGSYTVHFEPRYGCVVLGADDCSGQGALYLSEYYDGAATVDAATPVVVAANGTPSGIDASLALGGTISGVARDANTHEVLSNICVTASTATNSYDGYTCTDQDGHYTTDGLPAGSYTVEFTNPSGRYLSQTYKDDAAKSVAVTVGANTDGIDGDLVLGGGIAGKVTDKSTGKPLANVCVSIHDSGTGAEVSNAGCTGAAGTYASNGLPAGSYTVEFVSLDGTYTTQWWNGKATQESSDAVAVTLGKVTNGIDETMPAAAQGVTGVVSDSANQPLSGICAYLYDHYDGTYLGQAYCTPADGTYAFTLAPGSYALAFVDSTGARANVWKDIDVPAGGIVTENVTMGDPLPAPTTVTGTVTDSVTGDPIGGVCAYLYDSTGSDYEGISTCTLANGTYAMSLDAIPAGETRTYTVGFSDPTGVHTTIYSAPFTIGPGDDHVVDTTMVAQTSVTGVVTDAASHLPVADACVYLYDASNAPAGAGACADDNGRYTITGITAGSYKVGVSDASGTHTSVWSGGGTGVASATTVTVSSGASTTFDAAMNPITSITGTVHAAGTGDPLEGVCVYLYSGTTYAGIGSCTGADGRYTLQGMPAGDYKVAFYDPDGNNVTSWADGKKDNASADVYSVTAGTVLTGVDGEMSGIGSLSGTVTDTKGDPVAGVSVYLDDLTGAYAHLYGVTNASGDYTISDVPEGGYKVGFYPVGEPTPTNIWFSDASSEATATEVDVPRGGSSSGVDAVVPAAS